MPAGTPHTQVAIGDGPGTVHIEVSPARPTRQTEAFMRGAAQLCREGKFTRHGFPRPLAGAELVQDFATTGHSAVSSLRIQRGLAGFVLASSTAWEEGRNYSDLLPKQPAGWGRPRSPRARMG